MRKCSHSDRNFLAEKEIVGIMLNSFREVAIGERKVSAIEARANRGIRHRQFFAAKSHDAFHAEAIEA